MFVSCVYVLSQPQVKRYYIMVNIEAEETKPLGGYHASGGSTNAAALGSTNAAALNSFGDYFATTNDNQDLQDDAYSTNRFAAMLKD